MSDLRPVRPGPHLKQLPIPSWHPGYTGPKPRWWQLGKRAAWRKEHGAA